MDLLKYEFMDAPENSFNGRLGILVKKVRHYRTNVPIDDFERALPELQNMEFQLQKIDESIGEPKRYYIQEIMNELEEESLVDEKIMEEIELSSKAIIRELYDTDFTIENFSFKLRRSEVTSWIEFYGYKNKKGDDSSLLVIKEVIRASCYKYGIVFIDVSLNE